MSTCLIFAKSRVAPSKVVTIPRLELTAALTSVRVSTYLNKELDYDNIYNVFYTDSTVVLGYISNEAKRFYIFVANRVQQIRDASSVDQWNFVSSKENTADLASRGVTAEELKIQRFGGRVLPFFLHLKNMKTIVMIYVLMTQS